jgi:Ca2+-binding EF-hand superfamily protein
MFERIDKEEDGEVYVREVVEFLRVLDNNLEQSSEVFIKEEKETSLNGLFKG